MPLMKPFKILTLVLPLLHSSLLAAKIGQVEIATLSSNITFEKDAPLVRFSWKLQVEGRAQLQTGYRILIALKSEDLKLPEKLIWDSGQIESSQSLFVKYDGPPLKRGVDYHWKVQLRNSNKEKGQWSEPTQFIIPEKPTEFEPNSPSKVESRASFHCSDQTLNQLFNKTVSSRKNNLTTPPSFEPKEHPWGASLQLSARGYAFEAELETYYDSWLKSFLTNQTEKGLFPATESKTHHKPIPGHSESGLIVPFVFWQLTADTSWIDKAFEPAAAHLAAIQKKDMKFEGVAYGENSDDLGHIEDPTSQEFLSICHFALSCRIMIEMAKNKGHFPYIYQHEKWFSYLQKGFKKSFLDEQNQLTEKSQTAQILALRFGLLPPEAKQSTANALAKRLEKEGLTAGIFGQSALLPVLSWTNHHELAVTLAKQYGAENARPSDVALAATTEWMLTFLSGFTHQTPGFKASRVTPFIPKDGSITEVEAHHETPYGRLAIHWKTTETGLTATVTIPPNTTSIISLPGNKNATITEGDKPIEEASSCKFIRHIEGRIEIIAQSGTYQFEIKNNHNK